MVCCCAGLPSSTAYWSVCARFLLDTCYYRALKYERIVRFSGFISTRITVRRARQPTVMRHAPHTRQETRTGRTTASTLTRTPPRDASAARARTPLPPPSTTPPPAPQYMWTLRVQKHAPRSVSKVLRNKVDMVNILFYRGCQIEAARLPLLHPTTPFHSG